MGFILCIICIVLGAFYISQAIEEYNRKEYFLCGLRLMMAMAASSTILSIIVKYIFEIPSR